MFSHLLVPVASDTDANVLPAAAALARAFDATVVVIGPGDVLDGADLASVFAPDVAQVRSDGDLAHGLGRIGSSVPNPLVVCSGALHRTITDTWSGDVLVFGPASSPADFRVGGTIIVDQRISFGDQPVRASIGSALGFGFATVADLHAATPDHRGQIVVPERTDDSMVATLVDRWAGPVFLLTESPSGD